MKGGLGKNSYYRPNSQEPNKGWDVAWFIEYLHGMHKALVSVHSTTWPGMVACISDPDTQEAVVRRVEVSDYPQLHSEFIAIFGHMIPYQ